ncbi:MAG TPA: type II toxin-antitoxin system antitoxin SocA domain-containing protein [Sphingomicrobium sp.]|nr:type II toxin-antitoxin system antitoxin SocA domain-containing protein [Sphingomicrobium sp.]
MPAWSLEIANEFISRASADGKAFTQMHLQELVYIAHGWALALTSEPLTGDRPEAFEYGPEYRRLADALQRCGTQGVTSLIEVRLPAAELSQAEHDLINRIYSAYGSQSTSKLGTLTRSDGTPWAHVYADGAGSGRDIPHGLIREQFTKILAEFP